jgi:hypothetical protein
MDVNAVPIELAPHDPGNECAPAGGKVSAMSGLAWFRSRPRDRAASV